jgi:gentisate 1,2-dioxygenase
MPDEVERVSTRDREREPVEKILYEKTIARNKQRRDRAATGRIVIKASEVVWQQNRQAKVGYYLHTFIEDTALADWRLFMQEIETHSGSHVHQGGLVIYAVEGSGTTIVNGVAEPWNEGDVLLLPILPGGVEHQHFNNADGGSAKWLAFVFDPWGDAMGSVHEQREQHPNWTEPPPASDSER